MKDIAHKRQVKHAFVVMEPSNPFPTLAEIVDAEYITKDKYQTLDLPLEINIVTSKLESQFLSAGTYVRNPEIMFT